MKAFVVWATAVCGLVTVGWYGFLEPPWMHYSTLPLPALNTPAPGDIVLLKVDRCSSESVRRSYVIVEELVSDEFTPGRKREGGTLTPAQLVSVTPGCTSTTSRLHRIPEGTQPGAYHWEGIAELPLTWRTARVPYRSQSFIVRNPEPAPPKE